MDRSDKQALLSDSPKVGIWEANKVHTHPVSKALENGSKSDIVQGAGQWGGGGLEPQRAQLSGKYSVRVVTPHLARYLWAEALC